VRGLASTALLVLLAACRKEADPEPPVAPGDVEVAAADLVVKNGPIGVGRWRTEATYVLVEARNRSDRDLLVTLAGDLVDATGTPIGPLRRESIRLPAGGARLFALIDEEQQIRPAAGARVEIAGAAPVSYVSPALVTDGRVDMDQDRAVVAGNVRNIADREGSIMVIAAFFDAAGKPVQRTSTLFVMSGGGTRGVQLVGPPGSRSAYLFIGDVNY
jgi:hypothetical protein